MLLSSLSLQYNLYYYYDALSSFKISLTNNGTYIANDTSNHESIMSTLPEPIPVIGQTRGRMYKLKSYTYIDTFCRPFPTSGYPNLHKQYRR